MLRSVILALVLVSPSGAATGIKTSDDEALKSFRLTTENVRKSAAVSRRLAAQAAKDPSLARVLSQHGSRTASLDDRAKALERDQRIASALRADSIGAREYVMVQFTVVQARLVAALRARGVQLDPADVRGALNPANVQFVESHSKEIDELVRSDEDLRKTTDAADAPQRAPSQKDQ
jgi:hypothetical protein